MLVKEESNPKVYFIGDGKKVWIPTPDALFAMGYSFENVLVVPDGASEAFPEVKIDSASPTPGSLVFPPRKGKFRNEAEALIGISPYEVVRHEAITGVNTTINIVSQGREVRIIELRGWLYPENEEAQVNDEDDKHENGPTWVDWHYQFEVDSSWAVQQGIDLNQILKVGNILPSQGLVINREGSDEYRAIGLPRIGIEINGWKPNNVFNTSCPQDWTFPIVDHENVLDHDKVPKEARWPYDPRIPLTGGRDDEAAAVYVSVVGSLISDSAHDDHSPHSEHALNYWGRAVHASAADNLARHSEIHPPDKIEILSSSQSRKETLLGIAAIAVEAKSIFDLPEQEIRTRIAPPGPRPSPYHHVAVIEMIGPETYYNSMNTPRIIAGNEAKTGALISPTETDAEIYIKITGTGLGIGRFKALYRAFWEEGPHTLSLHVKPSTLPVEQPVQVTILAEDTQTRSPVSGKVMINGREVGSTNIPFSYTFKVERRTVPKAGGIIMTTIRGVHGKVIANGYADTDFNIGDRTIEGDI
jgi:hypothetical protein